MVTVIYRGKTRTYPGQFELTKDRQTNWQDVELHGFKCPNIYASKSWVCYLQPEALTALYNAQDELLSVGCSIVVVDAWRSYNEQAEARKRKPGLVARPELSQHPKGLAVDARLFDVAVGNFDSEVPKTWGDQEFLAETLETYGWIQTIKGKEPWHFQYKG